ncbi:hypothetical protein E4U30_006033 [Claviceps sp. LM220 group G6]|nr:hypothetical protein E4U15_006034 [Claviceps sp. LM218 group G6]KAG6092019.1 hypothetical protein E4U30_006033 [Claviceps sp. LM220 group G6]
MMQSLELQETGWVDPKVWCVADASCKHRIAAESSAEDHRVRHHASEFDAEREVPGDGNTPEHQQLL